MTGIDREGFRQIEAALRPYRERLERNGRTVAAEFEFVESLARFCVSEGQAVSTFDTSPPGGDGEVMTPIAVTYRGAAERLSVSEATIKREVRDGRIRVIRIGHAARIRVADLDAYANQLAQVDDQGKASTSPARDPLERPVAGSKAASESVGPPSLRPACAELRPASAGPPCDGGGTAPPFEEIA